MNETDFIASESTENLTSGSVNWQSPSNIALVKYWGKRSGQLPANPSVSFTLSNCTTNTQLKFEKLDKAVDGYSFKLFFEGAEKPSFNPKIIKFFERIEKYVPFIRDYHFIINTSNSFPHSSGIASSASSMSALALCIMSVEKLLHPEMTEAYFMNKASFLARLGSGSACRSIQGGLIEWGLHDGVNGSSDLFGIAYPYKVHEVFKTYQDTVLLVDKGEKQVSSTLGHDLMHGHPFAEQRFQQAHTNIDRLRNIFETGDLKGFIEVVESEALTLHAMMMTSLPYFILMKPNTLEIINRIWKYRAETGSNVCFTLDAGANVHVLYPENEKEEILKFIQLELIACCQNGQYICDQVGTGAKML